MLKIYLPYCVQRVEGDLWVVLNRDYKPLGVPKGEWIDYRPHALPMKISEKQMAAIDCQGRPGPNEFWLYDDGCVPADSAEKWLAYQARLQRLSALKVQVD